MVFVPLMAFIVISFFFSLKRFLNDVHENAVVEGKTDKPELDIKAYFQSLVNVIPMILKLL